MNDSALLPPDAAQPSGTPAPTVRPRRWWRMLVWGIGGSILLCALLGGIVVWTMQRLTTEQTAVTPVIDQFMRAMRDGDEATAYAVFSTRAQRQTPRSDLTALRQPPNDRLFTGYTALTVTSFTMSQVANTNPDVPQGSVATVRGTITYTDTITGSFQATLGHGVSLPS